MNLVGVEMLCHSRIARRLSVVRVAQEFDLDRPVAEGVLSKEGHNLVQAVPGGPVFVEEVSCEQDEVHLRTL